MGFELDNPASTWPTLCTVAEKESVTVLSSLSPEEKQLMWPKILERRPDIANLLMEIKMDSMVQELINKFDASIAIYTSDIEEDEHQS